MKFLYKEIECADVPPTVSLPKDAIILGVVARLGHQVIAYLVPTEEAPKKRKPRPAKAASPKAVNIDAKDTDSD